MTQTDDCADQDLVERVRDHLGKAGFVVDPSRLAVDGGVQVSDVHGRGVVVSWHGGPGMADRDITQHDSIRTAVHLALITILTKVGYTVTSDLGNGEVLVISAPDRMA
ncbi:hypothetical protein [Spongiactinospora sp. TRM90649]|uniref:hypothetical protein n=1 Tax=Spongiactinospora sp. TRM90649 TaxID=3031114 RepID=UPI0023F6DC81|nr:hypothetical protein [Spongiactinospora sp. TRM90649]MDF5751826.1 hypothetical protein [Spongiactinospora sp. TRM90649]